MGSCLSGSVDRKQSVDLDNIIPLGVNRLSYPRRVLTQANNPYTAQQPIDYVSQFDPLQPSRPPLQLSVSNSEKRVPCEFNALTVQRPEAAANSSSSASHVFAAEETPAALHQMPETNLPNPISRVNHCEEASACQRIDKPTATTCPISDLADADLDEIFKRLPPIDRLLVSEVCTRWNTLSRKAWLDITELDLSPIPGPNIAAVIRQCRNLRVVSAVRKTFDPKQLYSLSRIPMRSIKLFHCKAVILATSENIYDVFSAIFSSALREAAWEELVLNDFEVQTQVGPGVSAVRVFEFQASFPTSLKRFQICGVRLLTGAFNKFRRVSQYPNILQLQQLECLTACNPKTLPMMVGRNCEDFEIKLEPAVLGSLQHLRELHLLNDIFTSWNLRLQDFWSTLMDLPKLQVLFLNFDIFIEEKFCQLLTKHPTLRIIVITGNCSVAASDSVEVDGPVRVLYANGLSCAPLPVLHIFLDENAFRTFPYRGFFSDIAKLYQITGPLPQFLDRKEIKPLFEGVWSAEKIKEIDKTSAAFVRKRPRRR